MIQATPKALKGYRAVRNADGTWNIHDVPIYCANVRSFGVFPEVDKKTGEITAKELVINHNRSWLDACVETARLDFEERGYEAPLFTGAHHGREGKIEEAGSFMPRYVRPMLYEGKLLDTVFADLRNIPDPIFQQIKAKRLRYRSAEVPPTPDSRPEIKGLALLPHQPPHFKLQPLTVEELENVGNAQAHALAVYSADSRTYVLYDGGGMLVDDADDKKWATNGESKPGQMGAQSDMTQDTSDDTTVKSKAGNAEARSTEGKLPNNDKTEPNGEGAGAENGKLNAKGGIMDKILLMLNALCEKMGITDSGTSAMPKGPAEQPRGAETKPALGYGATLHAPNASFDMTEWASMKAKLALYDARFAAVDSEAAAKVKVETALGSKELKGKTLSESMKADLFKMAKIGDEALASYVAVLSALPSDPPKGGDVVAAIAAAASKESYPAEVLAYQASGEEAFLAAAEQWKTFKALGDRIAHVKLADFLKINLAPAKGASFFAG